MRNKTFNHRPAGPTGTGQMQLKGRTLSGQPRCQQDGANLLQRPLGRQRVDNDVSPSGKGAIVCSVHASKGNT
jgi:hypothetical protein